MKIRMFYHSLVSDWNHGNAHFLRGVVSELMRRGHDVVVYEPCNGWSVTQLIAEHGRAPLANFRRAFPRLKHVCYEPESLNLELILRDVDLVVVHEWNDHSLVKQIGEHRAQHEYRLLFHDTHHRMITDPAAMRAYDLNHYDGVLAFGEVLRRLYLETGIVRRAWTWHEAADIRVFRPLNGQPRWGDLVWIGNWGDDERSEELEEFLIAPARELGLKAHVYGVRYPERALAALAAAGIEYGGWLPNHEVPRIYSQFRVTLHIPRRPYVEALPGIPTIRPMEALACGMPLISSPWADVEGLFVEGRDYLVARDGNQMREQIHRLLKDTQQRQALAEQGLTTIHSRHTCAHRVDELLQIHRSLEMEPGVEVASGPTNGGKLEEEQ